MNAPTLAQLIPSFPAPAAACGRSGAEAHPARLQISSRAPVESSTHHSPAGAHPHSERSAWRLAPSRSAAVFSCPAIGASRVGKAGPSQPQHSGQRRGSLGWRRQNSFKKIRCAARWACRPRSTPPSPGRATKRRQHVKSSFRAGGGAVILLGGDPITLGPAGEPEPKTTPAPVAADAACSRCLHAAHLSGECNGTSVDARLAGLAPSVAPCYCAEGVPGVRR